MAGSAVGDFQRQDRSQGGRAMTPDLSCRGAPIGRRRHSQGSVAVAGMGIGRRLGGAVIHAAMAHLGMIDTF